MSDKIFCGSAKEIQTKYGPMMKISFMEKDLDTLRNNLDNGWVNAKVLEKKDKVDGKPTHYIVIDDWKPEPNQKPVEPPEIDGNFDNDEVLPF